MPAGRWKRVLGSGSTGDLALVERTVATRQFDDCDAVTAGARLLITGDAGPFGQPAPMDVDAALRTILKVFGDVLRYPEY